MTSQATPQPLSRAAVREIDRLAISDLGIPGVVLMENAARGAAHLAWPPEPNRIALWHRPGTVWIFCGPGNNGGDGYAMARWFEILGSKAVVLSFGEREKSHGSAVIMRDACAKCGIQEHMIRRASDLAALREEMTKSPLLVDAMLGTGFQGETRAPYSDAIDLINELRAANGPRVLAIDIPSGLDADTGVAAKHTVRADHTATFVAPKLGIVTESAREYVGDLTTIGIGVPLELIERVRAQPGV